MRRVLFALAVSLAIATRANSDEPVEIVNYFVAPVVTDVHRLFVGADVAAYAMVHASDLIVDGTPDLRRLDAIKLKDDLHALALAHSGNLKLVVRYTLSGEPDISAEAKREILNALEVIGRAAGFENVRATETSTTAAWDEAFARVYEFDEPAETSEPVVDSELVRTYPVRTRLSKMEFGSADCVVEIKRAFDGREQELSEELQAAIKQAVTAMNLPEKKGVLQYRVLTTTAGEPVVEKLFQNRTRRRIPANIEGAVREILKKEAAEFVPAAGQALATALGFDSMHYTHTPCGGAPEKLVGQKAPDFKLQTIDGEELALGAHLNGRPALVTFWGVACGPCCLEAPHLTALHEKHGADFAVLAVNAYNESQEKVSQFVEQTKLSHPIVLQGGDVAREQYHVAAYPTTFWINREGVVEDYEIDFDSAEHLEARVQAMLKAE